MIRQQPFDIEVFDWSPTNRRPVPVPPIVGAVHWKSHNGEVNAHATFEDTPEATQSVINRQSPST